MAKPTPGTNGARMIPARLAALLVLFVALAELLVFVLVTRPRDVPIRHELGHVHVWSPEEQAIVDRYFATHDVRKIQVGAGPNDFPDWLNTDIEPRSTQVYLDITQKLPFADHSVRYVYAEQVIEHVPFEAALQFLKECRRVLQPGGRLRIATPNLDHLLDLWAKEKTPIQKKLIEFQMLHNSLSPVPLPETALLNLMMHAWGHQFVYDPESLRRAFRAAGLEPIEVKSGESDDPALRGVEHHWMVAGGKDIDDYTSQFFEGVPSP